MNSKRFWISWMGLLSLGATLCHGYTQNIVIKDARTFVDMGGRTIQVTKPFTRIISLYGAHTENLFYLGLDREIIGVSKHDSYPPKVKNKKRFSSQDGVEKYLAENPDLILIRPMHDRAYASLFAILEKHGMRVVSLQPKNIPDMYQYWTILGMLTGKKSEAKDMTVTFKNTLKEFNQLVQTVPNPLMVYFEAVHKKMKTFTKGSMADFVLTTAGGINIASDGQSSRGTNIARYGKEKILSKASQIEVFIAQEGPMNRITKPMIVTEPGFSLIKAVQEDRIYLVDEVLVSRPTMRLLEGIGRIGTLLYPDVFQEKSASILARIQK